MNVVEAFAAFGRSAEEAAIEIGKLRSILYQIGEAPICQERVQCPDEFGPRARWGYLAIALLLTILTLWISLI